MNDDELRDRFRTATATIEPEDRLDEVKQSGRGDVRRVWPSGLRVAAVVLAVAACAGTLVLVLGRDGDDGREVHSGPSTTRPVRTTPSGWPDFPRIHQAPSQAPVDAHRDAVLPELAALPLIERADPYLTSRQGDDLWAVAKPPDELVQEAEEGQLGDPEGRDGIDRLGIGEYGEIVRVGPDGAVEEAFPLPYHAPTWLLVTDDAVYAGRAGDGASPESSITRISLRPEDRGARTVLFPPPPGAGGVGVVLSGWQSAPSNFQFEELVGIGEDLPGRHPQARSITGRVEVDTGAIGAMLDDHQLEATLPARVITAGGSDCCTSTTDGEVFTIADSSPSAVRVTIVPSASEVDPRRHVLDPHYVPLGDGFVLIGHVGDRDRDTVVFDCAGSRHLVASPDAPLSSLLDFAERLSRASGCNAPALDLGPDCTGPDEARTVCGPRGNEAGPSRQATLEGPFAEGGSWQVRLDPEHGYCVVLGDVNLGCDDVGPVVPAGTDPSVVRWGIDGLWWLAYGSLPEGAVDVRVTKRAPSGNGPIWPRVVDLRSRLWAVLGGNEAEHFAVSEDFRVQYVMEDGSLVDPPTVD